MVGNGALAAAVVAAATMLVAGCVTVRSGPSGPSASVEAAPSAASGPPVAADLTGGVPVRLGSAGHWVITGGRALIAADDGTVRAIDLATGRTAWQTTFPAAGTRWDGAATIGLSADLATAVVLATVDGADGAQLQLLRLVAATGAVIDAGLIADPGQRWRVDLPPIVLATDATDVVIADQAESGTQVGVIDLASGSIRWTRSEQGYAADNVRVYTRAGAVERATGAVLWRSAAPVGPLIALREPAVLLFDAGQGRVVWLDAATGKQAAATSRIDDAEFCRPAASALICAGNEPAGYDLSTGTRLWRGGPATSAVQTLDDWAYLSSGSGRGDVVDATTGHVLVQDAVLPVLKFSNADGIVVGGDPDVWIPR